MIQVLAEDLDEENNYNSDIRYSIIDQEPKLPSDKLFVINPVTGVIRVQADGLDREVRTHHSLKVFVFHLLQRPLCQTESRVFP